MKLDKQLTIRTATYALTLTLSTTLLSGCATGASGPIGQFEESGNRLVVTGTADDKISGEVIEQFASPWAMTYLPDGHALVTEKAGQLWLLTQSGKKLAQVTNVPPVVNRGQGGLGDVIAHPDFDGNGPAKGVVYLSYVEQDDTDANLTGAAVARSVLVMDGNKARLTATDVIWRQYPKVAGDGHFSHRLAFSPDGHLFISSGERQKFWPAQSMQTNLGKIIRVNEEGQSLKDNPFAGSGDMADQVWSFGHRNVLGMAFDASGQLWAHEMGPKGGDELNRIVRSENYGYPLVSNGKHYSGESFTSHTANPVYENPALGWTPVISPSGFVIYDGDLFTQWAGNGLIGGLSSQAVVRIVFSERPTDNLGAKAKDGQVEVVASEQSRYSWGKRIREVEQSTDGAIMVLEDGSDARLIRLSPL